MTGKRVSIPHEDLERLYVTEGKSAEAIGLLYGCSEPTVLRKLRDGGLPVRPMGHPKGYQFPDELRAFWSQNRRGKQRRKCSPEACARIGAAKKGFRFSPESRAKLSESRTGSKNHRFGKRPAPETRAKISARALQNQRRGAESHRFGKPPGHGKRVPYQQVDGATVILRSSYELRTATALDALGIAWTYEPTRFRLQDRTYCPDFYLLDAGLFYEVKGWFHERHQETIRQFREMNPDQPLVVLTRPALELLEVSARLGGT